MKTAQDYLRHADECDALARKAHQRKMISDMATTWRMLADRRKRKLAKFAKATAVGT